MFSNPLRGGKAFAAEQKIRELKTRIAKLNSQKLNIQPSKKYGFSPEEVGKKALKNERSELSTICIGQKEPKS